MTADLLVASHPLDSRRAALDVLSADLAPHLTVALAAPGPAWTLRLPSVGPARAAAADVLGAGLPVEPRTWSPVPSVLSDPSDPTDPADPALALRLGPDEWLVLDGVDRIEGVSTPAAVARDREQALRAALAPHGGAAVDVSDQRTGLRLAGPAVRTLLAFGCSLDLRPRVLPAGSCVQTNVWGAPVLLVTVDDEQVLLLVRPSFAGHLADRLIDAASELRGDTRPSPTAPSHTAPPTTRHPQS